MMETHTVNTQIICVIFVTFFTFAKNKPQLDTTTTSAYSSEEDEDTDCELTEIQCDTGARLHKIRYIWNINNLNYYRPEGGDNNFIVSPTFWASTNDKIKWYLEVLPGNGTTGGITLQICLSPESNVTKARAKFTAAFLDHEQNVLCSYGDDTIYAFDNLGEFWGWDNIPLDAVILPDDKMKIICNITFCEYTNIIRYYRNNNKLETHGSGETGIYTRSVTEFIPK